LADSHWQGVVANMRATVAVAKISFNLLGSNIVVPTNWNGLFLMDFAYIKYCSSSLLMVVQVEGKHVITSSACDLKTAKMVSLFIV
jgi:hypothetical protein